ncbi:hypothetical protein L596_027300 [Steinernema carpocapsae]|uniref:SWI/SNF-like complex subunit BAF250 C-terminal domain-containing protein n=1 Tax=Steinernema carpocapsae TaxID=34508 RepID=A0A4V5ZYG7_STECR|nr:hypothetical protein L596_027300 [Steinernema carpocapsae]
MLRTLRLHHPGQGPPPPGYHAGPPPPGGDPNAAYYYPPQQQTPHGWPQGAPPPQGYPPYGAPRMPPPQASYEEQQRYYQQQQQHHQQQQAQMAQAQQQMPQQPPQQTPSSQAPSNTLQVDVAGGSQVNSRAPSTGPAAADTPDSSSQLSAPGEDAANRPQSRPSIAPTPPATLATQPPPQGYYPGPPPSTSYGSPRPPPPPLRPMYPMAADGASTSGAYPPGMYPPASHPQMWQQPQRYPGPQQMQRLCTATAATVSSIPLGGTIRRSSGCTFAWERRSSTDTSKESLKTRLLQYGAQPPQQGPSQGATAPPQHQPGTPSMMPHQRGPSGAQMQGTPGHHAPATQAALSRGDQPQPQIVFPPGCVEATQPMLRKRRKILARELGPHVTPRRLAMSLRSGLDTELVWAINALNVILYDDTNAQVNAFSVVHAPELLTLAVEHLRATVNVLFPDVFQESEADQTKIPTIKDEEFWTRIEKEKQGMKQIVSATRTSDYNKVSRFGRSVRVEKTDSELPLELKRYRPAGFDLVDKENTNGEVPSAPKKKSPAISGTYLSERVTVSLKNVYSMECKLMKEAEVPKSINERKPEEPEVKTEEAMEQDPELLEEPALKNIEPAVWTELVSVKPTGLTSRFEALQKLVNRCLGLSNIIRGYSFLPGNEFPMSRHAALLFLIGRFLRLRCEEVSYATKRKERAEAAYTKLVEAEEGCFGQVNGNSHTKCVDVEDDARKIMDDLANQLRDDAFVILCHLSAQLNFFSYDSEVSWPIFDGLIHWICCKSITAKDPLVSPCVLTPRAYALEILCKMSVVEPNVDLLVATGPWNRFEEFVNRLAGWLAMSEEPHIREFSLVILNAICNISEEAAYFACLHTQALSHIVYFLEFTDTAMHTVVTQQGMMALRDSPELMGTSVGMLRRAATILHSFSKVRECRHLFVKQQQRLLALSMSQLMDSRVAQMIVETLFEVQQAESEGKPKEEVKIEPKEEEAAKEDEKADSSPSTAVSTNGEASAVLPSTSSPELKTVESPKDEEKPTTNGTPMSEGSPAAHSDDSLFRAPKMKKRPASPVVDKVLENGTNGNYAANKRRRLENGTNGGSKLNGVMDSNPSPSIEVDHTATTKNSMAAVA